ncbi:MAG TPA: methylmalonyl-CoA epimerase [Sporosarcina sp.]|nr:methylmalonyl-CoA epimerase [Sporosarcina sp.]
MKKVDHIGIAVTNVDEAIHYYIHTHGLTHLGIEEVENQYVRVAFIDAGNIKLELLEPIGGMGPIQTFLEKRGEGIHHIAFDVEGIRQRMEELRTAGVQLLGDEPKTGAGGAEVMFLHPKSSFGVLYELCDKTGKGE